MPCTGHRALALADVERGDALLVLCRGDGQVTTRDFRQQVQASGFALQGQRIDACLRQGATGAVAGGCCR